MKSFLFLFLLSLRIPQSTFCQWRKNLRQLLSSIFVGVDSYQPRIKGVPGYDVSRLWVPSVWSVRPKIPSALLCFSLSPANISRLEIGKTCILVLAWSRLWFLRQPGRQTRNVSSEDYRTTGLHYSTHYADLVPLSLSVGGAKVKVSWVLRLSWSDISQVPKDPIRAENKWSAGWTVSKSSPAMLPPISRYKNQIKTSAGRRCCHVRLT